MGSHLSVQIKLGKNKPTLQKSVLGWLIAGSIGKSSEKAWRTSCHFSVKENIQDTVNKFWLIEDCGTQKRLTEEEAYVERFFENNHYRNKDGKFVIKMPTKQSIMDQLGESEGIAMKRLISLEKRFKRLPELKEEYVKFMNEYLRLGHMKLIEQLVNNIKRVFLPHQAVIKKEAVTTKTRVVFDASSKNSKGFSLNDALYKGAVIQSDLFSIIIRFRCFKYAISADIKKMYRQIIVYENQRPLQTILWRENPNEPV